MACKEKQTFVVVEDSIACAKRHKQELEALGAEVMILRGLVDFEEKFTELVRTRKISGVITDGLHGDWQGVVNRARELGVPKIWIISGSQEIRNQSRFYPSTKAISKSDLHKDPSKYKEIF